MLGALLPLTASPALAATQWGSYQWQMGSSNTKISVPVDWSHNSSTDTGPNNTGPWTTYVDKAMTDWSVPTSDDSSVSWSKWPVEMYVFSSNQVNPRKCPPQTGHVQVCNYSYGYNGWLGVAQIWTSGNFIVQGSVKLNDSYFNSSTYDTEGWKLMVVCQEVGHTIGLSHDDETFSDTNYGTCMDYTSDPTATGYYHDYQSGVTNLDEVTTGNIYPNDNDYGLLGCMYDGSNTACATASDYLNSVPTSGGGGGSTGPGKGHGKHLGSGPTDFGIREFGKAPPPDFLGADAGNSPAEWGNAVAFTADGRGRVFERQIAPGRKIITHVFWAPR